MERSVAARRFGPLAVFAVVLAVLVALAARDGSGPGAGSRDLLPIPIAAGAGMGARGAEDAARPSTTFPMYYGGEIVVPARLLDGLPTEGPVHDVTAGDTSAARIGALARALGIDGEVRSDEQGWIVGESDFVLRVFRGPGTHWYLGPDKVIARPVPGDIVTAEPAPDAPKPSEAPEEPVSDGDTPVAYASDSPACAPDTKECVVSVAPCPSPPPGAEPACGVPYPEPTKPPQPTDAEAKAVAQRVFDAVGLAGAAITVNDAWSGKEVVAAPVVAGLPTAGFETRVTVELGGAVQYATGFLGGTSLKDVYPLLGPAEAANRGGGWAPYAGIDIACPPGEPCPTPEPREATRVRLGLTFSSGYDPSRRAFLAPAWLLTFGGSTWEEPVLALPDRFIETPEPGEIPGDLTDPAPDVVVDGGAGSTGSDGGAVVGSTGAPE